MNIIDKIIHMEESENLFDVRLFNQKIWIFMRNPLLNSLSKEFNKANILEKKYSFKYFAKIIWNAIVRNTYQYSKQCDCLFVAHSRRILDGGKYVCKYTDYISDRIENSLTYELPHSNYGHYEPTYTKGLICGDAMLLMANITSIFIKKLYMKIPSKNVEVNKITEHILASIKKEFNDLPINNSQVRNLIIDAIGLSMGWRRYVEWLLDRVKPKIIVDVVGYSTDRMMLHSIAKERGIPTIELQHGVINHEHKAYNFCKEADYEYFADYLFVFGDYWKNARYPIPQDHIVTVGFPYVEKVTKAYPKVAGDGKTFRIIVLSQWTYNKQICNFLKDLLELIDKQGISVSIALKLHPEKYKNELAAYLDISNHPLVEIVDSKENLYNVFSRSDIQIGIYSTALYEGYIYGLRTYILDIANAKEQMADLFTKNYAYLVSSGEELASILTEDSWFTPPALEEFFAPNAIESMKLEIEKICSEHTIALEQNNQRRLNNEINQSNL